MVTMLFPLIFAASLGFGLFWTLAIPLDPFIEGDLPQLIGVDRSFGYWVLLAGCLSFSTALSAFPFSPLRRHLRAGTLKAFIIALPLGYVCLVGLFLLIELAFFGFQGNPAGELMLFALWAPLWYAPALATLYGAYRAAKST
jgi:hypothetical protein